jgi:hypothetical protein
MNKKIVLLLVVFGFANANAQTDVVFTEPRAFKIDSLVIAVHNLHTQDSAQEKMSLQEFVMTYFKVIDDTLYSNFPLTYEVYWVDNPVTNTREKNKVMVYIYDGNKITSIPKNSILGVKNRKIAPTKKPNLIIELSL